MTATQVRRSVERAVEVKMDDGTWQPGVLRREIRDRFGHAALIDCAGITGWLYRERGSGNPNEWREVDDGG